MNMASDHNLPSLSFNSSLLSISAVSWSAVMAGAVAAAAMSLILLILGMGLGLSSVSPWTHSSIDGKTLGIASILWIFFASFMSSGLGGYIAGRLRTRWLSVPVDEVYFRDTAHGFLAWAIATLATATLLTTVIGKILVTGIEAGVSVAGDMAQTATVAGVSLARDGNEASGTDGGLEYTIDTLFRRNFEAPASGTTETGTSPTAPAQSLNDPTAVAPDPAAGQTPQDNVVQGEMPEQTHDTANADSPQVFTAPRVEAQQTVPLAAPRQSTEDARTEITTILLQSIRNGSLAQEDVRYGASVLAESAGLSQQEAEQRLNAAFTAVREAETAAREMTDDIRSASAKTALWLFISLLIGAFIASLAATYGGRQRDL